MSRIQRTSTGCIVENLGRLVPTSAVSPRSVSSIQSKHGEKIPSIRHTLFSEHPSLSFYVVRVQQVAYTERVGYPSKLYTSHPMPTGFYWARRELYQDSLKPSYH